MTIQQHSLSPYGEKENMKTFILKICETVMWYNFGTKISEGKNVEKRWGCSIWHYKNEFLDLILNLLNYNKYQNIIINE